MPHLWPWKREKIRTRDDARVALHRDPEYMRQIIDAADATQLPPCTIERFLDCIMDPSLSPSVWLDVRKVVALNLGPPVPGKLPLTQEHVMEIIREYSEAPHEV